MMQFNQNSNDILHRNRRKQSLNLYGSTKTLNTKTILGKKSTMLEIIMPDVKIYDRAKKQKQKQ
jgi:hypothetical protein